MTEPSPAARAIVQAFDDEYDHDWLVLRMRRHCLAAALRVLADQVTPESPMIVDGGRSYEEAWTATVHEDIRRKILSIANELEAP